MGQTREAFTCSLQWWLAYSPYQEGSANSILEAFFVSPLVVASTRKVEEEAKIKASGMLEASSSTVGSAMCNAGFPSYRGTFLSVPWLTFVSLRKEKREGIRKS